MFNPSTVLVPPRVQFPDLNIAEPVALYRHVDARGELLYVGITSDPGRRWLQHVETSFWARFSDLIYVQWYPDRPSARHGERSAIRAEDPIFNTSRPGHRRRAVVDRQLTYLRTGSTDTFRRVPCRFDVGSFCISCGPDYERWFDSLPVVA